MSEKSLSDSLSPAAARRIDQACDRFEAAWKSGQQPELSEYVKVEAATAGFIEGLNDKVVLISTSEFLAAKFAMYVANMPTPTPSAIK